MKIFEFILQKSDDLENKFNNYMQLLISEASKDFFLNDQNEDKIENIGIHIKKDIEKKFNNCMQLINEDFGKRFQYYMLVLVLLEIEILYRESGGVHNKSLDASEIYIVNSATLTIQYLDFLRCFLDLYCELCHFDDTISRLSKVLKSLDASEIYIVNSATLTIQYLDFLRCFLDLYCELCHFDDTISRLSKVLMTLRSIL
ncbi:hypothetical protein Avbf_12435 [Armadillidium vulgare]|nr:hypothetical protein Avbf_12435 [Armadillidium vulgare]